MLITETTKLKFLNVFANIKRISDTADSLDCDREAIRNH